MFGESERRAAEEAGSGLHLQGRPPVQPGFPWVAGWGVGLVNPAGPGGWGRFPPWPL